MNSKPYLDSISAVVRPLKVQSLDWHERERAYVVLLVDDARQPALCAACQCPSIRRDHLGFRTIRHLDFGSSPVLLKFRFPRVDCPTHGRMMAYQTFFVPHSSFSFAFEDYALSLVTDSRREADVARAIGVSRSVLRRILDRTYRRNRRRTSDPTSSLLKMIHDADDESPPPAFPSPDAR